MDIVTISAVSLAVSGCMDHISMYPGVASFPGPHNFWFSAWYLWTMSSIERWYNGLKWMWAQWGLTFIDSKRWICSWLNNTWNLTFLFWILCHLSFTRCSCEKDTRPFPLFCTACKWRKAGRGLGVRLTWSPLLLNILHTFLLSGDVMHQNCQFGRSNMLPG